MRTKFCWQFFFSCSCFILLSYGLHAYIRKYFVAWKREREVEDLFDLIWDCQMRRKEKECAEKFIVLGGPVIDEFSLFWGCDWMIDRVRGRISMQNWENFEFSKEFCS